MDHALYYARFLFCVGCYCLYAQFVLGELRWDAQIRYLVNQSSDDRLCLFVYLLNSSGDLDQQIHVSDLSPRVTVERQLTDLSSQYYYSNVTVYSDLIQAALEEQAVCPDNELSFAREVTERTPTFLSGCISALSSCALSSPACLSGRTCQNDVLSARCVDVWKPTGNFSGVWVLDTRLEHGYDLTVTVDEVAHQEIRPKRLFLRKPLFPWSFLVDDVNFVASDATKIPVNDGVLPVAVTSSCTSLWMLKSENTYLVSTDSFQTGLLIECGSISNSHGNYGCTGVIGLSDRILFSTPNSLKEARWDAVKGRTVSGSLRIALNRTVMLYLGESSVSSFHVWAIDSDKKSLFLGQAVQDEPLKFRELGSERNKTACSVLAPEALRCQLISLTLNPIKSDEGTVLALVNGHYVVIKTGLKQPTDALQRLITFPSCFHMNVTGLLKPDALHGRPCRPLLLHGMLYTKTTVPYLFAWGNVLLVSIDEGRSFHNVAMLEEETIAVSFASSTSGHYAVVADNKILVGHVATLGFIQVSDLRNGSLGFFFSEDGFLYTILMERRDSTQRSCINAKILGSPVPLAELRSASCERLFWRLTTWSVHNSTYYTRQHIIKKSLVKRSNASSNSVMSFVNDSHSTNSSGTDRLTRIVTVAKSDQGKRKIHVQPPVIDIAPVPWEQTVPNVIYLNRHDVYEFVVALKDNCAASGRSKADGTECLDQIHLSVYVTSRRYLHVVVKRTVDYVYGSVQHTIKVQDRGLLMGQHQSGKGLSTLGLHFQGWYRSRKCISDHSTDLWYNHPMTVRVGCPPGLSMLFDAPSTAAVSQTHWNVQCDGGKLVVPCFDFSTEFKPLFRVIDHVTETSSLYDNVYTVNVVGIGKGSSINSITLFTETEKLRYNSVNGSHTLWTRADGEMVKGSTFNGSVVAGINWVCGPGTPCDEMKPASAVEPIKLFLLLEFSNRVVSQDYCDFTFQFAIQLRSIPVGSITIVSALLASLASLVSILLVFYVFHSCGLWNLCNIMFEKIRFWTCHLFETSKVHPVAVGSGEGSLGSEHSSQHSSV